jgi:3-oxoadipate enol-lactonase
MHYRGHGESPTPPRPWRLGLETLADDADALCAEAGFRRVVVVGFSMGFQVALELYRRHRTRVAGLVSLAGPAGRVLDNFQGTDAFGLVLPVLAATSRLSRQLSQRVWKRLLPSQWPVTLGFRTGQVNVDRLDPKDLELYLRQLAELPPDLFLSLLEQAHRHCALDVVPNIRVPSLVIAGGRDGFVPPDVMRDLAFSIPGAQWELIESASHALPAEYPDELAARIGSFLSSMPKPSSEAVSTAAPNPPSRPARSRSEPAS